MTAPTTVIQTSCCIVGGGPAGMMLGYLLARAGVQVVVLEKHADFLRDFRGDTVHPSTLNVLDELGLLDAFLQRPHHKLSKIDIQFGEHTYHAADFTRLPGRSRFIAFMPQWEFLNFLAEHAAALPSFRLMMSTTGQSLIVEHDRIVGVKAQGADGDLEIRADLVVGADGRTSDMRQASGLQVKDLGAPIDVLWFRIGRDPADFDQTLGRIDPGRFMVTIDRGDYWQCAYVIRKGEADAIKAGSLEGFKRDVVAGAPRLADHIDDLTSWNEVKLLSVTVDRLEQWSRPGLLCIGDSAHAMSPVGGVGINMAIQDAVAAANILAAKFKTGGLDPALDGVRRRRLFPTQATQAFQVFVHRQVLEPVLAASSLKAPLFVRLLNRSAFLRGLPARFIGLGVRPEHVKSPIAYAAPPLGPSDSRRGGLYGQPHLPKAAMARYLITSALPYINGIKHLGNLAGSMLPADVYARFQRARGHEVLYICATDEHGTPAELAAAAAGQDVASYCAEQHVLQDDIGRAYGLSWDWFGRSSSPQNHRLTQHFAEVLEDNGLIEERTDRMVYSVDDRRFLPDRYVEGTCPHCGYTPARGDQCDNCGRLLDPVDLIDPYSAISGTRNIEVRDTRHLYLLQTKLEGPIRAWIDSKADWPLLPRSIAYKHLEEGLIDRGITRDLAWGVPVMRGGLPRPGFEDKVFYVWFDAPIEYIAATQEWADAAQEGEARDWRRWWRTDEGADEVRYVEFMGKDNVAFHTVSFPATLIGSGEPWKMVDTLKAFNWLNWYGGKFSTSQGRGVFMDQALELLPPDYWRWYLTANTPESSDTAFTWEQFQSAANRDLADVLGNFVNRILKFCETRFEGVVPAGGEPGELELKLYAEVSQKLGELTQQMESIEVRKSAQALRELWVVGNQYLQEAAPWTAIKTDPARAAMIVRTGLNLVALFARVCGPILPFTAGKIAEAVGEPYPGDWPGLHAALELSRLQPGRPVRAPEVLFRKIEDAQTEEWAVRFGGADA